MQFRGRTVLLMIAAAVILACVLTAFAISRKNGQSLVQLWNGSNVSAQAGAYGRASWDTAEMNKLNKALQLIEDKAMAPADRKRLLDGAIAGMVQSLGDPYSEYMTSDRASAFSDSMNGAFTGIGVKLEMVNHSIVVLELIDQSPAKRAGLKPKDTLLTVNGQSLSGLSLDEVIGKIRGPRGTKAKLGIGRQGIQGVLSLELVRDRIDFDTVEGELGSDGIGKLWIGQFGQDTESKVKSELAVLEAGGMKALVIDVRGNPGGMLTSVFGIAELFIPKDAVMVQYETNGGQRTQERSQSGRLEVKPYPIFVLVDERTASSAEILAGALRQSAGAKLIGQPTYGKGTVQTSYERELGDGSLMKLTVCKWLLPDGTRLERGKGLVPDRIVAQPDYFAENRLPRGILLRPDDNNETVKDLQVLLGGAGYQPDRKDGYYSPDTQRAVERFQEKAGLPVTGSVDDATVQELNEVVYEAVQNAQNDNQWQAVHGLALRALLGNSSAKAGEIDLGMPQSDGKNPGTGYDGRNFNGFVEYVVG